jgi:hypothetical protein
LTKAKIIFTIDLMSTFISRRLFIVSTLILSSFIIFTAYSFAQEPATTDTTLQQVGSAPVGQISKNIAERKRLAQQKNSVAREQFSRSVASITNEAKKNAVERINTALQTINEKKTNAWVNVLDRLSAILDRIKTKLVDLETDGVDTSSAMALVTSAENALASAIVAVETQAGKTYILEIEDEQTLGQVVRPVVQQFKTDLRTTLSSIQSARDAVRQAARGLAQVNSSSNNAQEPETTLQNSNLTP